MKLKQLFIVWISDPGEIYCTASKASVSKYFYWLTSTICYSQMCLGCSH